MAQNRKAPREISELMRAHGFHLHRSGRHFVWKDDAGAVVTTSTSPSDCARAQKNVLADIHRAQRRVAEASVRQGITQ